MNNEKTNNEERNFQLAKYFLLNKSKVHIQKNDGIFYNGFIVEIKPDFFFIEDREDGKQLVFFKELSKPISEYKELGR